MRLGEPTYAWPCRKSSTKTTATASVILRARKRTDTCVHSDLRCSRFITFGMFRFARPKAELFVCQFFPHSSATHAHRIAPNQDNLELSVMRERGLHVGIMDWLQIWVVANALLLACWVLGVAGEMKTRDRINYRTWVISGMPEVEPFLRGAILLNEKRPQPRGEGRGRYSPCASAAWRQHQRAE